MSPRLSKGCTARISAGVNGTCHRGVDPVSIQCRPWRWGRKLHLKFIRLQSNLHVARLFFGSCELVSGSTKTLASRTISARHLFVASQVT
jgi:hypothetical protein